MHHVNRTHLDYRRRAAMRMLIAFIVTFGIVRLLTFAIHNNLGPFHDIVIGGGSGGSLHIHHYIWGLTLVVLCGFLALTLEAARWHPLLAIPFGIGLALVLDEFALLVQLKDVYWSEGGIVSLNVGVLVAAVLLVYLLAQCYWRDLARELRRGFRYVHAEEERVLEHWGAHGGA
ncbi:MAG: hypothetical protein ABR498_03265 [Candidatus Dormibacteria bacterium]